MMDIKKYKITDIDFNEMSVEIDQNVIYDKRSNTGNMSKTSPSTQSIVVIKGGWMEHINNKVIDIMKKDIWKSDDVLFTMSNWVYIVGKEDKGGPVYHNHLSMEDLNTVGQWSFVYYTSMPDILEGDDGVIYFKNDNGEEYNILPKPGDLLIFPAELWHLPKVNPKSNEKRRVLAGTFSVLDYRDRFTSYKKEVSLF